MSQVIGPYDAMSLITYTPRADSNDRGYEQWLIDVDNPFFNGSPVCVRYTNWKVIDDAGLNPASATSISSAWTTGTRPTRCGATRS